MKKHLIFSFILFSWALALPAQEAPKYDNEFLSIGVGAKAMSLSNAVVAGTNDVTAAYWNPAGLNHIQRRFEISAMHAEYFAGMVKYDYLGASYRIDSMSVAGISIIRSGVDDIPNTLDAFDSQGNLNLDNIKYFSVADYGFIFSYARQAPIKGLRYGANAKIIYRHQGEFATSWGFGLDAGIQYDYKKWQFGAMARDITSTFNVWIFDEQALRVTYDTDSTQNEIPENTLDLTLPRLMLGAKRSFQINSKFRLSAEADIEITFDGKRNTLLKSNFASIAPNAGVEIGYQKLIYLRLGVGNFQTIPDFDDQGMVAQPNIGLGLRFKHLAIDYALTDIGSNVVSYSNIFSLIYRFDTKK